MSWFEAIPDSELGERARRVVKVQGRSVLLIREDGQLYAVASVCPHMRLPLKGAKVDDHTLVCPWHHSAFDLVSGDVKEWSPWPPAVGRMLGSLSKEKALSVYPVKVSEGSIWIELPSE